MKNFLKFVPKDDSIDFKIKESTSTPTLSKDIKVNNKLSENVKNLTEILHYPLSNDIQFRFFDININNQKYNALLIFYDGMVDSDIVNNYIVKQLMQTINVPENNTVLKSKNSINLKDVIAGSIVASNQLSFADDYDKLVSSILHGDCALLVDSLDIAFIFDVKNLPSRSVTKAENEMTLKGPSEAFIENFRTNTALIRKFVKDENLIFESIEVGNQSTTHCAIAYISTLTNDSIIDEVRRRINSINIDYLLDSGQLEQLIEDRTFLIDPLILSTEKPDKVAAHLTEGRVAILVEGSSNVLIVPAVFSDFTQSTEDSYVRYPYSILLKFFRFPAIFFAIFLPGIYIAICNFHQEMIPTDLLFAIAGTREKVPFTMLIELLIMEVAFEIIREASIRTPAPVRSYSWYCRYFDTWASNCYRKYC